MGPGEIITATQGVFDVVDFIKTKIGGEVISGHFKWDGTKIHGSERIELVKENESGVDSRWWYYVKGLDDYTFLRFPLVNSGVHELLGTLKGEKNADARYWRWVPLPRPNTIVGGNSTFSNAKVDFIVIGYKPKTLIEYFHKSSKI